MRDTGLGTQLKPSLPERVMSQCYISSVPQFLCLPDGNDTSQNCIKISKSPPKYWTVIPSNHQSLSLSHVQQRKGSPRLAIHTVDKLKKAILDGRDPAEILISKESSLSLPRRLCAGARIVFSPGKFWP